MSEFSKDVTENVILSTENQLVQVYPIPEFIMNIEISLNGHIISNENSMTNFLA